MINKHKYSIPPALLIVLLFSVHSPAQKLKHIELNPNTIAAAQQCLNWCWAAGAEMLLRSQGVAINQKEIVSRVYGPTLPCLPTFGSFEPIRLAVSGIWRTEGGDSVIIEGAYNYGIPTNPAGMIRSISDGRPFLFAYGGHIYVAYGLSWHEYPYLRVIELELIDPLWPYGKEKFTRFNVFFDDVSQINGTFEIIVK